MPSSLLEISGIAFNESNSDTVYSVQDENGKLFRQQWDVKKQKNTKFAPNDDFEDISIMHQKVFILNSNGSVYSFPLSESLKKETDQVKEAKHIVPKGEYEGMFADAETNKVYIICKSCPVDKKAKTVTGYIFDYGAVADSLISIDTFKLDLKQLKVVNAKLKTSFSASALARNLKTNEWYVLSSANKLLVVTDAQWNIKTAHRLNSSVFNQPEGIAFDKEQNLFISNEGDEVTDGNILKFKYVHKQK
ncbi:SdiA-regulated family protein [Pedobacter psychroterrae]|uniref:SdiA-regulated family protein n=2 Tax=Pedobacter psychroterrae TaxID=2530453 RepID=A0A4R0NCR8_9SPHI|nr:SdiA-regulated family protein [Pedobacter psychroterrae]